jgi:hypothetical protein
MAWILWGIVHIFFLIGFRNRVAVFLNWIWAWLTYGRGARLITGDDNPARSAGQTRSLQAAGTMRVLYFRIIQGRAESSALSSSSCRYQACLAWRIQFQL